MQGNFRAETGVFCFLSNIRNFMCYHDLEVSESFLGGMLGYLGFYYSSKPLPSNEVVHGRNGSFADLFQELNTKLSTPLTLSEIDIDAHLVQSIQRILSERNIVLIWLNDYFFEHSPYYQLGEFWSLTVLLEVRETKAVIFDNGIKEIDLPLFLAAANKVGKAQLYFAPAAKLNWIDSEIKLLAAGLKAVLKGLNAPEASNCEYGGFLGMKRFVTGLEACDDPLILYNFYFQMNRPGGLSLTRENMRQLWVELKDQWGLETTKLQQLYESLANEWRKSSSLLFKLSTNYDADLKGRIVQRILNIIALEKEGADSIGELIMQMEGGKTDHEAVSAGK